MPPRDIQGRVSTLEAVCQSTLPRIEAFMKEGVDQRVENAKNITSILDKVTDFHEYQEGCDAERKELRDSFSSYKTATDKRIVEVEGFQGRLLKAACAAGLFAGFLVTGGAKIIEFVAHVISTHA